MLKENPPDSNENHRAFHGQTEDSANSCKVIVSESNIGSDASHGVVNVHDYIISTRALSEEGHHDHISKKVT